MSLEKYTTLRDCMFITATHAMLQACASALC